MNRPLRAGQFFRAAYRQISALVYPQTCAACDRLINPEQRWCGECFASLAVNLGKESCPSCGRTMAPHEPLDDRQRCTRCPKGIGVFTSLCRVGSYEGPLAKAIMNLKYHHRPFIADVLAEVLHERLVQQEWFADVDALIAVPTHWTRRYSSGFSHTQVLTECLSNRAALPVLRALEQVESRERQARLAATARAENVKDIFRWSADVPVAGSTLCLVDDVMTTGSTLLEAGRQLRDAGAGKIYAAVVARADQV